MLRINQSTSSAQAKGYYSTADYYLGDHELPGTWHGKGAARLGLSGEVSRPDWESLCDNLNPISGSRLTQRMQQDRRVGYDLTFNVPKTVSLLYGITQDERILEAFRASVDATMADVESEMKTRVRTAGSNTDRVTGEAAWGTFIHFTGRPENGVPDPHLHAHCFVFNTTFDKKEDRWKAGQFGDLKRDGPYFEALFHVRMAEQLGKLGLPLERTKEGYEIAGFDRALVKKFSRRTERIEKLAAEKGITNPDEKGQLGAKTRNRKADDLKFDQLADTWRSWLTPEECGRMSAAGRRLDAGLSAFADSKQVAKESLDASLEHHFERASVVSERKVLAYALKRAVGQASVATVLDQYARAGVIVGERDGRRVVTTREVLEEERKLVDFARSGRGTCNALGPEGYQLKDARLSTSQRSAVERMLTSPDRVILLRGAAGVGKTTIMKETIAGIEQGGREVFTFAPSAAAGRGVLREEVSEKADTVAFLLKNERLHPQLAGQVIWIDEAGLVGTKTLRQVFELAQRVDARVILSGDKRQHGSVERGAALRLLETEAGLVPAELSEIRRQSGKYREAVQALADGKTEVGFEKLDKLGWIHEVPAEQRYERLAADYTAAVTAMRPDQKALIVSPTHKEAEKATLAVRAALKKAGRLGKKEQTFGTLQRTNLTAAERADPLAYGAGDVIEFNQNAKGYTKGERVAVGEGTEKAHGVQKIPVHQAAKFQVFHTGAITLAPGDDIRLTAGGESAEGHRLNNGAIYTVKGFTPEGDIRLNNGWTIDKDFGHLEYGYVTTSHASQGKSVERVFIAQSEESHPASSREQFYVSVSRGKARADIYCDDAHSLLRAVQRSDDRISATELVAAKAVRERTLAMRRMHHLQPTHHQQQFRERDQERARQ